jgi:hypothetical protein
MMSAWPLRLRAFIVVVIDRIIWVGVFFARNTDVFHTILLGATPSRFGKHGPVRDCRLRTSPQMRREFTSIEEPRCNHTSSQFSINLRLHVPETRLVIGDPSRFIVFNTALCCLTSGSKFRHQFLVIIFDHAHRLTITAWQPGKFQIVDCALPDYVVHGISLSGPALRPACLTACYNLCSATREASLGR